MLKNSQTLTMNSSPILKLGLVTLAEESRTKAKSIGF